MIKLYTIKGAILFVALLYTSLVFAGNPAISLFHPSSNKAAFNDPAPASPIITGFSPSSGPVGTSVTISGTNFNTTKASNIVFFGATRAIVTAATESSLTVTVPVGATFQPISVLDAGTQLTGYSANPFITTFSPNNSNISNADFFSQLDLHPTSTSTAEFMTTGDLDGDGKADLVSVNSDATTNNLSIFRNISNGGTITAASFDAKIEMSLNAAPAGIAIGDLNGDGKPDLIALDASGVSIFKNTSTSGAIAFAPKMDLSILNSVSVSLGDLDNDGKPDIVVSDRKDGIVIAFRNTSTSGTLSFATALTAATLIGGGPENTAIGDLNGDGKVDLTVVSKVSGVVTVFPNISTIGSIVFGTPVVLTPGLKPVKVALGDFNADGKPDLAVANSTSASVSVFQNTSSNGTISFATKLDLNADTKVINVVVADLDGDGKVDIVSVAVNGGGTVSVYRNTYTSGVISATSFTGRKLLKNLFQDVTIGDIDGDGRSDLAGTNLKLVTVLRYNPFKTKVSDAFSGKTLANMDSVVRADVVPLVSAYRFRVTQGANVQIIDAITNSFKFTQLGSYAYNTAYSIDVQVQAGGVWSDYGAIGVVTTPAFLTQISESLRGKTIANIDSPITADPLPLATAYRFRVTKDAAVQTIDATTNSFKFTQLNTYVYNAGYSIDVQAQIGGNWSSYGTAYVVNTPGPITQISESFSGKTLLNTDSIITADPVPLATGYRFRVTKDAAVQTLDAPTNSFKMKDLPNYAYNTMYSMDVAVKTDATLGAFGAVSFLSTPPVPVTQVTASSCGAVLTDLDGFIRADALPLATAYRFRIKQGSNEQVVEEAVPSTLLYKTNFYAYNTTYTVDVSANVSGTWTDYGTACNMTTLSAPVTQVSLIDCGKLLTTNDGQIHADHVPTATAYRFRITTNGQTDSLDVATNFVRLAAMPSYEFNTTYSIRVSALVNGVWTTYGPACNVTTPVLVPQLSTEVCGTTLTTIDGEIHEDLIPATMFRFKVKQGANIDSLEVPTGSIRLASLSFYAYNTVFNVQVAVMRNGVWTPYGPACDVTTLAAPFTQLASNVCGTVLNTNGDIRADNVPTATAYRFRATQGSNVQTFDSPTPATRLTNLPGYAFNTTYSIDVASEVKGVWTAYGVACSVTTAAPLTNASLSAITLSTGTLSPVFDPATQAYTALVSNATASVTLTPRVADATATVKVNGTAVTSGSASGSINLAVGPNTITVVGTAQDGTTTQSYTITVTRDKAAQTITLNPLVDKIYGDADFDPGATSDNPDILITYTSSNTDVATVVSGKIHIKTAGLTNITASQAGDITHYAATDVMRSLTVNQRQLAVTATATNKGYDGSNSATIVLSDDRLSGDLFTTNYTATFDNKNAGMGKTVNITGIGLSGGASANYVLSNTTTTATADIATKAINVTAQTDTKTYDGSNTSAVVPVTDTLATGDVILTAPTQTFNNKNIGTGKTLTAAGLVITDGNSGNNYSVTYVTNITGKINAKAINVTAQTDVKTYDGTTASAVVPVTDALASGDVIATAPVQTFDNKNIGSDKTLTAAGLVITDGNSGNNYSVTYVTNAIGKINAKTINVTAQTDTKTYDGTNASAVVPVTDALATGDVIATNPAQTFDNKNIGSGKTLTAAGLVITDGNSGNNYAVTYVSNATGKIAKKAINVTAQTDTKTYDGTNASAIVPVTDALATGDVIATNPAQTFDNKNIGTGKTLTAAGLVITDGNSGNNYSVTYVSNTSGKINTKAINVTAQTDTKTYDGTNASAVVPVTDALAAGDVILTAPTQTFNNKNAGTGKTLTAAGLVITDGNSGNNYAVTYVTNTTGKINAQTLAVTAQPDSKTYDATTASAVAPVVGTLITGDVIATAPKQTFDNKNVGTGKVLTPAGLVITDGNSGNNYAISYITNSTGVITTATLTYIANAASRDYGAVNPSFSGTVTGFAGSDVLGTATTGTAAFATTATVASPVGSYAINGSGLTAVNGNYTFVQAAGNATALAIGKTAITVTAAAKTKVYGAADPQLTYSITTGALANSDAFTGAITRDAGEHVGGYAIKQGTLALSSNYTLSYVPASLSITPAALTVKADNQSTVYGQANPALTVSYTGFVNGDDKTKLTTQPALVTTATASSAVGAYPITASGGTSGDYTISYTAGTLTVTNAALMVTADNQSKVYGQANPALTVTYSGFVNGDDKNKLTTAATATTTAAQTTGAGSYPITAGGAAIPNYTISYTPGTLAISKAPLTITADNQSRNYGVDNPALTLVYSVFVNGDTQASLATPAAATTTATATTAPGTYAITPGGAASANYSFNYVNGTLTIIPLTNADLANLTVSAGTLSPSFDKTTFNYRVEVTNDIDRVSLTPTFEPTATIRINGVETVNGIPSSGLLLNVDNNTLTVEVTAQDGITKKTYTLIVYRGQPPVTIAAANILSPNGDGKNDTWVIKDIQLYPNNMVSIYDRAGRTIYEKRKYNNEWDGTLRGVPLAAGTYYYTIDLGPYFPKIKGFITILHGSN